MKVYLVKSETEGKKKLEAFSSKGEATKAHNAVKANGGVLTEKDFDINSKGILEAIKFAQEEVQN